MYSTTTQNNFVDAFISSDTYKNNFSYEALKALFDYLEDYEEQTDQKIEFDMIALCCEYTEYPSAIEAVDAYTEDAPYLLDEEELLFIDLATLQERQTQKALDYLEYRTTVIQIPDSAHIIIQNY